MYWTRSFRNSVSVNSTYQAANGRPRPLCAAAIVVVLAATSAVCYAQTTTTSPYTSPTRAGNEAILSAIPADALAVYSCRPGPSDRTAGGGLAKLISVAGLLGLFGRDQQTLADTISVALELCKYPHAVILLDVSSKRLGEGSFALRSCAAALVVQCKDGHGQLLALLDRILDHYFTRANAKISWVGSGAYRRQQLTANDLPQWCVWQWGKIGELFVFTVGRDAYDRIAARINTVTGPARPDRLTDNLIIDLANQYDRDLEHRLWLVYFNVAGLDRKLRGVLGGYYDQILDAVQLRTGEKDQVEQVVFSAGYRARAFISKLYLRWPDGIEMGYLTRAIDERNPLARRIPSQAGSYALAEADVSATVAWAVQSYLSIQNPARREEMTRNFNTVAKNAGLANVYGELFDHMGPTILVHDWPRHPLNWPFAKTIIIRHDGGEAVKKNWARSLAVWQTLLDLMNNGGMGDDKRKTWTDTLLSFQLDKTGDNIAFLHVGPVVLAAGAMTDDCVLLSWSPAAVRVNLAELKSLRARTSRPTQPASSKPAASP